MREARAGEASAARATDSHHGQGQEKLAEDGLPLIRLDCVKLDWIDWIRLDWTDKNTQRHIDIDMKYCILCIKIYA